MKPHLRPSSPRKIGLIGGLALRAGVFYYEQILKRYVGEKLTLKLLLNHADVDAVLACVSAGDKMALGQYLGTLANELFDAGADIVAVTAVAPHMAIEEIARVARGPLIDVLEVIPAGLAALQIEQVAIFGNRVVMNTSVFGSIPAHMVVRLEPSVVETVHAIYNNIALTGKRGTPNEVALLEDIARDLISRGGAQAVVLAGTDLSSFYAEQPPSFPVLDVAELHINEIVHRARS
ncbi:aspartate/glutamate racemase family protein [Glacieibacterium megasporae]|uniref:aspartate/glutamate racemase family protein n=1 Tax=Glacieibacterium megasporae TaxID=2835787 RepID=UPI001C1E54A4|nr:aspartate/glutamate racemase family protein [Polymorphobacter megasporae]UAJ10599.1 aspartate/glutamate racemase family protein [Polymorphobacter megasporae]